MEIRTFAEELKKSVESMLGDGYTVSIRQVSKNNDTVMTGFAVWHGCENATRLIYLEPFYECYLSGTGIGEISEDFVKTYRKHVDMPIKKEQLKAVLCWEKVKEHVVYRLINGAKNRSVLRESPHTLFLDLAQVYFLDFRDSKNNQFGIRITNEFMTQWGITKEELHQCADKNMPEKFPVILRSVEDVMMGREMGEMTEEVHELTCPPFYIMSNENVCFGAATLLYGDGLEWFAKSCDSDVAILPSSIHEVLLLPDTGNIDYGLLREMVRSVNAQDVPAEDRLSSHVYRYARETKKITIVDGNTDSGLE